jgi:hypothetical protein
MISLFDWIYFMLGPQPEIGYDICILLDMEREYNMIPESFKDIPEHCAGFLVYMEFGGESPWVYNGNIYYGFRAWIPQKLVCGSKRCISHELFTEWCLKTRGK